MNKISTANISSPSVTSADLIREMFAIIDTGRDWQKFNQVFAPNGVYFRPGYPAIRGIENLQEFYTLTRQVKQGRHYLHEIVSEGSTSCCWGMFSGTTKSGERVVVNFTDWYKFANRLITYRRTFFYQPVI